MSGGKADGPTSRWCKPLIDRVSWQKACVAMANKAEVLRREARNHLEVLPGFANLVIGDLLGEVAHLDERIKQYDEHVRTMARDCNAAQQLMQLMGLRPLCRPHQRSACGWFHRMYLQ